MKTSKSHEEANTISKTDQSAAQWKRLEIPPVTVVTFMSKKSGAAVGGDPDQESSHHNPEDASAAFSNGSALSNQSAAAPAAILASEDLSSRAKVESQLPPPDYTNTTHSSLSPLSLSPRSRPDAAPASQLFSAFSFDETVSVHFLGLKESRARKAVYYSLGVLSLGSSLLVCYWFPKWKASIKYTTSPLSQASHILCESSLGTLEILSVDSIPDEHDFHLRLFNSFSGEPVRFIEYSYNRFVLHPETGLFVAIQDLPRIPSEVQEDIFNGLSPNLLAFQKSLFGPNDVVIQKKSTWQFFVAEVLHPFNIFQIFSIVVWCFETYFIYAAVILIIAIGSISTTLYEMKTNFARLREMSHFECPVEVVRDGEIIEISSIDLVPGDALVLSPELKVIPCDAILLNGDVLVDESMLTGETIPIAKQSILELHEAEDVVIEDSSESAEEDPEEQDFAPNENIDISIFGKPEEVNQKSLLYAGTTLIRAKNKHGRSPLAIVLNTSLLTAKGNLIQTIMFPRPNKFKFHLDSLRFILMMACIAGVSFMASIFGMRQRGETWSRILICALDLITVIVPPALPATMAIGTAFALSRLKKKNIFCISPPRIAVSSRIDCMCFDKTGTLTEEGLKLKGVISGSMNQMSKERLITSTLNLRNPLLTKLMAVCHSVQTVNDEVVGDPLDLEMFNFTRWSFVDCTESIGGMIISSVVSPPGAEPFDVDDYINASESEEEDVSPSLLEMGVLKCFEFNAALRRMAVLARELDRDDVFVFCKGSPESIREVCSPDSLPANYDAVMSHYAHMGYRLIACAGKILPEMPWLKIRRYTREQAEDSLAFLGFLVFENPLKPNTASTLGVLADANIRSVMCTGDNPLTAVCVGRACGMLGPSKPVFLASLQYDELDCIEVFWENLDDTSVQKSLELSDFSFKMFSNCEFAMTGAVFEHLLRSKQSPSSAAVLERIFKATKIYARMSPNQKQHLVELFQSYGLTIGFCGDGANDCGALKAADVGISLSQAEASIAAPFTSRIMDISCVLDLIKEGRASLSTSFACFKFMTLYSMIQYTSLTCLFYVRSYPTDMQFMYSDLCMIIPLGVLLSRFEACKRLSKERPVSRLVSFPVISSILSQIVFQAAAQFTLTAVSGRWKVDPLIPLQNSAIFLIQCFLYPLIAAVYSFQYPHRQGFYLPFYLFVLGSFVFASLLSFGYVPNYLKTFFNVQNHAKSQSFNIILIFVAFVVLSTACEFIIIPAVRTFASNRKKKQSFA